VFAVAPVILVGIYVVSLDGILTWPVYKVPSEPFTFHVMPLTPAFVLHTITDLCLPNVTPVSTVKL
jgi:hypothetical protein